MAFSNIDAEINALAFARYDRARAALRSVQAELDRAEDACTVHSRRCTCPHVVALRASEREASAEATSAHASWVEAGEIRRDAIRAA